MDVFQTTILIEDDRRGFDGVGCFHFVNVLVCWIAIMNYAAALPSLSRCTEDVMR